MRCKTSGWATAPAVLLQQSCTGFKNKTERERIEKTLVFEIAKCMNPTRVQRQEEVWSTRVCYPCLVLLKPLCSECKE